jgi:hypothetical protein
MHTFGPSILAPRYGSSVLNGNVGIKVWDVNSQENGKLKKAIRVLNQTFNELNLEKHPDKTVIGRIEKGFDFLGYRFEPQGLTLAKKTITNFFTKALRLYEQEPPHKRVRRLGEYLVRWSRLGCIRWNFTSSIHRYLSSCLHGLRKRKAHVVAKKRRLRACSLFAWWAIRSNHVAVNDYFGC